MKHGSNIHGVARLTACFFAFLSLAVLPVFALVCPYCKTENPDQAKFCFNCGKRLDVTEEKTEPVEQENPSAAVPADPDKYKDIRELINSGDLDKALERIEKIAADSPDDADIKFLNGLALNKKGLSYDSVKILQDLTQKYPDYPLSHYIMGLDFMMDGFADLAINEFSKELEITTDNPDLYFNYGLALVQAGSYKDALSMLEKALTMGIDNPDIYYYMGIAYSRVDDIERAKKSFLKTVELKPDMALSYYNLGFLSTQQEKYEDAYAYFSKALTLKPDDLDTQYSIADVLHKMGRTQKAVEALESILKNDKNPEKEKAYSMMASYKLEEQNYSEALDMAKKALAINPDYAKAYTTIGIAHLKLKNYKEAQETLATAADLDPFDAKAHFYLAQSLEYKNGARYGEGFDIESAIYHYKAALEIDPSFNDAFENLTILADKKDEAFARQVAQTSLEQEYSVANAYFDRGDYSNAVQQLNKILSVDPNFSKASQLLVQAQSLLNTSSSTANQQQQEISNMLFVGDNLVVQGRYDEAIESWEKVLSQFPNLQAAQENIAKIKKIKFEQIAAIQATLDKADDFFRKKDYSNALSEYNKILVQNPRYKEGQRYIKLSQKRTQEILKLFKDKQEQVNSYIIAGDTMLVERRYDDAVAELNKVLSIDPSREELLKKIQEAQDMKKRELESMQEYFDTAKRLVDSRKFVDAILELNKILAMDPQFEEGRRFETEAKEKINKITLLIEDMKARILDLSGQAELHHVSGEHEKALEIWKEIRRLDPTHQTAREKINSLTRLVSQEKKLKSQISSLLTAGKDYLDKEDYRKAVEEFEKIIALDPANIEAKSLIIRAEHMLSSRVKEKKEREDRLNSLMLAGETYLAQKRYDEAIKQWIEALKIDPDNKLCEENIALAHKMKAEQANLIKRQEEIRKLLMQKSQDKMS